MMHEAFGRVSLSVIYRQVHRGIMALCTMGVWVCGRFLLAVRVRCAAVVLWRMRATVVHMNALSHTER